MKADDRHSHQCAVCGVAVECGGTLERNEDGWPPTICDAYHQMGGTVALVLCDDCAAREAWREYADGLENV